MATFYGPARPGSNQKYFQQTGKTSYASMQGYGAGQAPAPAYFAPKVQQISPRASTPQAPQNTQQPYDMINQQQNDANAQIDADYNDAMGMLSNAESGFRGQADTAGAQITNDAAGVRTSLGSQQATGEAGVQLSLQTAEQQGKESMYQARNVFRETQQQNNAQLSALGISSSSVAEALAERLGVDVARRIAGVQDSLSQVQINAKNELGRIKNYYAEKATQLEENVRIQKSQIQQSLMQGLNQINQSRGQAAQAKAQARANLLSQVQSQIYQLTTDQQQFDQQLQQWAAQKTAALTPIANDSNYIQKLMTATDTFNQKYSTQGFQALPEVNYDKNGAMTGSISFQKNPTTKKASGGIPEDPNNPGFTIFGQPIQTQ